MLDACEEEFRTQCVKITNAISQLKGSTPDTENGISALIREIDGMLSETAMLIKTMEVEVRVNVDMCIHVFVCVPMCVYMRLSVRICVRLLGGDGGECIYLCICLAADLSDFLSSVWM